MLCIGKRRSLEMLNYLLQITCVNNIKNYALNSKPNGNSTEHAEDYMIYCKDWQTMVCWSNLAHCLLLVSKVLLEQSHIHLFMHCLCFCALTAKMNSYHRDHVAHNTKNIYYPFICRKSLLTSEYSIGIWNTKGSSS